MICPPCLGTGISSINGVICTLCRGRGALPDSRQGNPICPPCLGTGISLIKRGLLCEVCGGWGRLPNEPNSETSEVIFVSAGKVWDTHKEVAAIFKELRGELCVCDPFYGTGSLLRLSSLIHCRPVRFLTQSADSKEQSFIGKAVKEFTNQYPHVEFRRCASRDLHDRYLLTETELVILGHGLKDIGGKDSFVIRLHRDICKDVIDTLSGSFNEKWRLAAPLP
jgi:hypothetical protein